MVLLPNNEDFSQASGVVNSSFLEEIYHCVMDEMFVDLGRTVTFHLQPSIEQDDTTQSLPAPQQYNPFFGGVANPNSNTRRSGTKITHRDVEYLAQIKVGPIKAGEDVSGMGDLDDTECVITVVIEALPHVSEALSVSIEGRRYSIEDTRPIGFSTRRYLMVKLKEIQESERGNPDITIG